MANITMKRFIDRSNIPASLVRAVVRQSGGWENFREMAADVAEHGADCGFSGWIYYTETCAFYKKNRKEIIRLAKNIAGEVGMDGSARNNFKDHLNFIKSFGCIRDSGISIDELVQGMSGYGELKDQIQNCLSWFALEEVARAYADLD